MAVKGNFAGCYMGSHVAGENVYWGDCIGESEELDVRSSRSARVGVALRVDGTKRSFSSLSTLDWDWRGASLVQGPVLGK